MVRESMTIKKIVV